MTKFSRQSKLPYKESQAMIMDLCSAIASTHNTKEAAQILTDLLSRQELEMIAKRLNIAELLLKDHTYEEIKKSIKTSDPTIARVHSWLQESGEGYRLVLTRTKVKRDNLSRADEPVKLSKMKRKYPQYYWPQILLENWIKKSNQKEKQQMRDVLDKLGDKRKLYASLDNLLKQN